MAGKTKSQKKKRAKMKKRTVEEQRHNDKEVVKKIQASKPADEANNNAEPSPPKVNEDAGKDAAMLSGEKAAEIGLKRAEELIPQQLEDEAADLQLEIDTEPKDITDQIVEASKFDPTSVVANILKKKEGG